MAFADAIFQGQVSASATVNVALLVPAYQSVYGDIYANPADFFASKYAAVVPGLLPGTTSVATLSSEGEFPSALFSSTPPTPSFAIDTPAT